MLKGFVPLVELGSFREEFDMAELLSEDRARVWRVLMRWWSNLREGVGLSKSDLRAAVDATDAFIDGNQVAYNSALPEAARTNLTQTQKTVIFCAVAVARGDISMLRGLFGEVD